MPRPPQTTAVSRRVDAEARAGAAEAVVALVQLVDRVRGRLRLRVVDPTLDAARPSAALLARHQEATHALAALAAEVEAGRQLLAWAEREGGELPDRIASAFVAETVAGLAGGVRLGACERVPLAHLDVDEEDVARTIGHKAVAAWAREASTSAALCALAADTWAAGPSGVGDEATAGAALGEMRHAVRRFAEREVAPLAGEMHRTDGLVPLELLARMADLGVFGCSVPTEHGGLGLGKEAMCVITEELARAHLGTASLATRSEIAVELLLGGGTDAQRQRWLSGIASGQILPAAAFTEPDHGSDLAHCALRALRQPQGSFRLTGQKTWVTHAARADLLTVLARTSKAQPNHDGLSMFLVPKTRGTDAVPFPDEGLSGSEVRALGYRGMREYELSFDGYRVGAEALLGGVPGMGFKQLMATLETARIHTAARAVGVAQAALEQAMRYAHDRNQFGAPIAAFARVAHKLGRMVTLVAAARQLTWFAARAKDSGRRCDLQAAMAKLFASAAVWEVADACIQIHGGHGYAEESVAARLLVDARVFGLFEGTSEIQAEVVARRLLEP
jgi:(2S)-methylsuccinyl-CoA dehydrogenase